MIRIAGDRGPAWLLASLCALALVLGPAVQVTWAQDGEPAPAQVTGAPDPTAAAPAPSPASAPVDSVTAQAAAALASSVQQEPSNIAIPVQVLSPGNSGPVTQENVSAADAGAVNSVQSAVPAPTPTPAPAAPAVSTPQSAVAAAQSTQVSPSNVYIPVTILSPGNTGPVTQINVSSAQAVATNVVDTAAQIVPSATAGVVAQVAAAGAASTQQAPSNFSAPVTIADVPVGDHPASQPWIWTWDWQLDCGSSAIPPVAALGPIIAQVTGGAWEWHWTWTCAPAAERPATTPVESAPATADQGTTAAPTSAVPTSPGGQAATPPPSSAGAPGPTSSGELPAQPSRESASPGGAVAAAALAIATDLALTAGDITIPSVISPRVGVHTVPANANSAAPAPSSPGRPPTAPPGPPPPLLAAGAFGGSGPAPLSIGLAALIGAFCLSVPRLGARARTQLVHRSAQAVPNPRDRPG